MNKFTLFKGILFGLILLYSVSVNCDAGVSNASKSKSKAVQPTEAKGGDAKEALVKPDDVAIAQVNENYGNIPLYFIQNDGQIDEKVKFYERGSGHSTYFTKEGVYLELLSSSGDTNELQDFGNDKSVNGNSGPDDGPEADSSLLTHGQTSLSMPPNTQSEIVNPKSLNWFPLVQTETRKLL